MNTTTGRFTIPNDGYYSISFSGALNSLDGSRTWIKLNMKDGKTGEGMNYFLTCSCSFLLYSLVSTSQLFAHIGISDCVLGAGFTSLTFDAKSSKGNKSPKDFTLSTSPMLATLEKLKKNDEIWISVGRKKRGSSLAISMGQPAILNVKMLAEDKIEEEKIFE